MRTDPSGEDRTDWDYGLSTWPSTPTTLTRANAADGYPAPLTPLSQDLVLTFENQALKKVYAETFRLFKEEELPAPFFYALWGFVYLNADNLVEVGERMPGSSPQALFSQLFGLPADPEFAKPKMQWSERLADVGRAAIVGRRLLAVAKRLPQEIENRNQAVVGAAPALESRTQAGVLAHWLTELDRVHVAAWMPVMWAANVSAVYYEMVRRMLISWLGEVDGPELTNGLHTAVGGNESADAGRAVQELARLAVREGIAESIVGGAPYEELSAASPAFALAHSVLIDRFGHRAPNEFELSVPTWRMNPGPILDAVRIELRRGTAQVQPDRAAALRTRADAELARRLNRLQLGMLSVPLARSRKILSLRETGKGPISRLYDQLRLLLESAAPLLCARGVLDQPSSIFYLRHDELHDALNGAAGPGVEVLLRRRSEHDRCATLELPELIQTNACTIRPIGEEFTSRHGLLPPPDVDCDAQSLTGIGAAPGTVSGIARVMHSVDGDFDPGDILVARTVDPGWAPILSCAGAVVLDIGGVLSHGAVVARELGVPCVVNVKHGREVIKDGATITVNGTAGTVEWAPVRVDSWAGAGE